LNSRSDNSGFFAGADKVGTFLFTNLAWAVLSITVIGIPFATLGLFAMMNEWIQGRQPELFKVFWGSIRNHWQKAILISLMDIVISGILYFNFTVFQFMGLDNIVAILSLTMTVSIGVVFVGINVYIWSLMPLLTIPTKNLIKLSLIFVLTYPVKSLLISLSIVVPTILSIFLPIAFFMFVTVATSAYIAVRGTWWILQQHFSIEELEALINE
jgi:uncharacterized membrane protein YesL